MLTHLTCLTNSPQHDAKNLPKNIKNTSREIVNTKSPVQNPGCVPCNTADTTFETVYMAWYINGFLWFTTVYTQLLNRSSSEAFENLNGR